MRRVLCGIAALLVAGATLAAPTPAPVRAEIDALLDRLSASGCEFGRNDAWHAGADAKAHLLRKLEYIEKYATVGTTEQFIDVAATRSSVSGTPYLVRCGNAAPVQGGPWLTGQLKLLRGPAAKPAR